MRVDKIYIGADNGVTASWGIVGDTISPMFFTIPTFKEMSFQKTKKKNISRVDTNVLYDILCPFTAKYKVLAVLERPMLNSARFDASISAARALEATLIVLAKLNIGYEYIDSKAWQKILLPNVATGETKQASRDVATRLFPQFASQIKKHKDGDGILIAEYARRLNL